MNFFVFRNNTIERFFPKGYAFSGYDDISVVPQDAEGYVWFYQLPVKYDTESLCAEVEGFARKLQFVLAQANPLKPFIVFTMDETYAVHFTSGTGLKEAISGYNSALAQLEKDHSNVKLLDISEFMRQYPADEIIDWKYWFISQMGMNPRLSKPFLEWYLHKLDEIAFKRKKCLVLDLDNTLWGGILGEDGIEGIKIGGDYPGKAYHLFQEAVLELGKNGVILAICSKNNENDVLEAWDKNPFMVLKKDSFATWRINWTDKATNLREIAEELNIGLDSFVFVDDNPAERELIRQVLPMVEVPDFPIHPYELPPFFRDMVEKYFRVYLVTKEDKDKTEQYRANAQRAQTRRNYVDFDAFLESLDIRMSIEKADEFSIPRIAQMTQKTNQFNLTTRRYTDSDIRSRLKDGWEVWCLSVSDRFGDSGITGAILLNGDEIDSLLLSCRILGKMIEDAFLKSVLILLKNQGVERVKAAFIPTPKNTQVKDFYERCGFYCVADHDGVKEYVADLKNIDLQIKSYYHIAFE